MVTLDGPADQRRRRAWPGPGSTTCSTLAASGDLPATLTNLDDEGVAQVVTADGRVLAASPNVRGRAPRSPTRARASGWSPARSRAPDDAETETYRLWAAHRRHPRRAGHGLRRHQPGVRPRGHAPRCAGRCCSACRVVVLLLAGATWLVLGRALRRVDRIRAEVDAITEDRPRPAGAATPAWTTRSAGSPPP